MNSIFEGLNDKQKKAVEILTGPLLILAGAGSGKTKCLTHRIANLIAHGAAPNSILAVTFTNKAANEMKTRVEKLLQSLQRTDVARNVSPPIIGTFHAICVRILREDIESLGTSFTKQFVIFDTSDTHSLMKMLIKDSPFDEKEVKFKPMLSHISSSKNSLLSIKEYLNNLGIHPTHKLYQALEYLAPRYIRKLEEHNALDFDDLLLKTVQLFEQRPEVLKKYQNRWQHILVDEYQDTNFSQYRIIQLLVKPHQNLCVIGDDHQSIYSFRGADYTNILNFEKDFPNAQVVKLEQNYRSTKHILKNANALIDKNQSGRKKDLWTDNESGEKVKILEVQDEKDEGNYIAQTIVKNKKAGEASYADTAILYRMNAQSRAIEEALMRNQIPYQIIGGTRFFDRAEIKDMVAYLRLIFNPKDNLAFLRIINVPTRKLGAATLDIIKEYAQGYQMSMFEVLEHIEEVEQLPASKRVVLKNFYENVLTWQQEASNTTLYNLLDAIIETIGYYEYLDDGTAEGEARAQNVKELFTVANRYESADFPLSSFLEGISLMSDIDNMKAQDSVTLMTIHASKGLEFPQVFLPGWEDGIFPGSQSQFSNENFEEERRLGYVAITRAEKKCTISHARQRTMFGKTEYSSPSKFLSELHPDGVEHIQSDTAPSFNRSFTRGGDFDPGVASMFEPVKTSVFPSQEKQGHDYNITDKVEHQAWGQGIILNISGDVLTISFSGGAGLKKVVGSVAPMRKI